MRQVRGKYLSWEAFGLALIVGIVLYLTLAPLLMILFGTFRDGPPGTDAAFTFDNYRRAFGNANLLTSGANSLVFSLGAALVSFCIGTFLAWVTERTNTPFKSVIYAMVLFPFVIPGILITISWVLLLSPKIGLINWFFTAVLGFTTPPFNIYSMGGMIWVFGVDHVTLPFFLMAAAFRSMDPSLEEAAHTSGMGFLSTIWHVNLKLMIPSILAIWLLLFVRGIETFEAPAVIGIPAGIKVFATEIFLALKDVSPDYNLAGTYAIFYLIITIVGILLYLKATAASEKYTTITGKGYRPRTQNLGVWRYVAFSVSFLILFVTVLMPVMTIVWTSFLPFYSRPSRYLVSLMTLQNYKEVVQLDMITRAFMNNVFVGGVSAIIAVLLAAGISWIVIRTRLKGRKLLDIIAFTPIAIPGMVMGLALLWIYLILPIPVYGTLWILVIGYVTKYIPIALRASHSSMLQLHPELEEASEISGSSWPRTFFRIVVPLILPGLLVGWFYVFTLTFKVLSLPVLLSHVGTEVFPVVIFILYESGEFPALCALGVMLIGLLTVVAGGARIVAGRFGVHER